MSGVADPNVRTGTIDFDQPLPGERIRGERPRFYEYQRYPAFTRHWLIGRSILFGLILSAFALMVMAGNLLVLKDFGLALQVALLFLVGFMSFSILGPALATWVRHRRWPLLKERIGIVLALLLGLILSGVSDSYISNSMNERVQDKLEAAGLANPKQLEEARKHERTALGMALKLLTGGMIYGLFGGGIALVVYWREPRRRKAFADAEALQAMRTAKAESEQRLSLLQSQVEPHFLFNTLAAVRASLRSSPADAEAMLDALIDYLRATIPKLRQHGQTDSSLGDQLDLVGHYLRLMQLRMGTRLSVQIAADPALRAQAFPPLLLLTLVENAIKHGLEPKPGPVNVSVVASAKEGQLRVQVIDDGVGLGAGTMGSGVGLQNLREHLLARYGQQARFELASSSSGGTVATMTVPMEA